MRSSWPVKIGNQEVIRTVDEPYLNPLLLGYLGLPNPAACFHGFAGAVECTLLG
jgi:hypothetical protein